MASGPAITPALGPAVVQDTRPAVAPAAVQQDHAEEDDDLFASPPGLWLPRMVVKPHRKKATIIWVVLLIGFLGYVSYIVWETVESRKDPASSIELKQEHYRFPDVMLCPSYLQGCQFESNCSSDPVVLGFTGFVDDSSTFMENHAHVVEQVEEEFWLCEVIPLSRLTPNETAINNGDVKAFSVLFFMLWDEGLDNEFDDSIFNNQYVNMYFVDIDDDVEEIGGEIVDAVLPYSRMNPTSGIPFSVLSNHMVMDLTEFAGITSGGNKEERQRTFSQSTTTAPQNWVFEGEEFTGEFVFAYLSVEMTIGKFEYTSIEEVDPVDLWSILGAIGGIWQFVVTGFGLFFVFSVKQAPDRKIRNFKKSMAKPAAIVNKRLSSLSAKTSDADVQIDASDEDLPTEWVKKRRPTGSIYYFNVLTGAKQDRSPNDLVDGVQGHPDISRGRAVNRIFTGDHPVVAGNSPLPPGWVRGTDDNGKLYYINTITKTSQLKRPSQRSHSTGGRDKRPQIVDAPMLHMRRGSNASSIHSHPSSSSGAPTSRRGDAAQVSAASSPPDPDAPPPPLGTPGAPSYRTVVHLLSGSATAAAPAGDAHLQREHKEEVKSPPAYPSTASGAPGSAVGVPEVHERTRLPPNWRMRTTADNTPYYENTATKKTQWKAPHS